jgi:hypothetical protein
LESYRYFVLLNPCQRRTSFVYRFIDILFNFIYKSIDIVFLESCLRNRKSQHSSKLHATPYFWVMWLWRRPPGNSETPPSPALWSAGSSCSRLMPLTGRITSLPNHTFLARYSISNTYSLRSSQMPWVVSVLLIFIYKTTYLLFFKSF